MKKKVKKREQKKDEMKMKMEEELPYVRGIKFEETAECLLPQVEQQTENMRSLVCPRKKELESIVPTRKDTILLEGKGCHQPAVPEEVETSPLPPASPSDEGPLCLFKLTLL